LRHSLLLADLERSGGIGVHASPLAEVSDVGNILQKSGFALPATDTDSFKIRFPDAIAVMELLSASGESNAVRYAFFLYSCSLTLSLFL
jgi:NADH dehydrogenase [ubiquinone] 1 alpha subcomplex assembly factor 5